MDTAFLSQIFHPLVFLLYMSLSVLSSQLSSFQESFQQELKWSQETMPLCTIKLNLFSIIYDVEPLTVIPVEHLQRELSSLGSKT